MNSLRLIFFVLFFNSAILCCDASTSRVLIVENLASPGSIKIAHYYFLKRRLPAANLCTITCPATEQCSTSDVVRMIIEPIRQCIHQRKLKIDYIVLTKGIPIEFNDSAWSGFSIDSVLTTMDNPLPPHALNPYFAATDRFSQHEYGIYLVTRLDGWSVDDCLRLVDHGLATHPGPGPIYLHPAPNRDVDGYYETNQTIRIAAADLAQSDVNIFFDQSDTFHFIPEPLDGYYTWASNDAHFDNKMYQSLVFSPGAIAETVVSTSGRTFEDHPTGGQSLIADLVADGVTGCKGYVSEPLVDSMAHADIMFDHYTQGWNLADSFYAASRYVNWKDIVIGDPLCAPYASHPKRSAAD